MKLGQGDDEVRAAVSALAPPPQVQVRSLTLGINILYELTRLIQR